MQLQHLMAASQVSAVSAGSWCRCHIQPAHGQLYSALHTTLPCRQLHSQLHAIRPGSREMVPVASADNSGTTKHASNKDTSNDSSSSSSGRGSGSKPSQRSTSWRMSDALQRAAPLALAGSLSLVTVLASTPLQLPDASSRAHLQGRCQNENGMDGLAHLGFMQPALAEAPPLTAVNQVLMDASYAAPSKASPAATEPLSRRSAQESMSMQNSDNGDTPENMGLGPEELKTIRLFESTTPAVVNITNLQAARVSPYSLDTTLVPAGTGSGFVWDAKGHIVTNYHVIRDAVEVKVTLLDQSTYTVLGGDADKDVAVLALDMPEAKRALLRPVSLGTSARLLVGQRVFALGNPFGLDHTLTQGIVSGVGRELNTGYYTIKNVIQTDAAINPGNSGGVLLDSGGRVIGINTAIADPTGKGSYSGVGFAIPIDAVKGLVGQILQYGRVIRPVLGVTLAPPQVLRQLGQKGVLVYEVPKGSPADKAGLKPTTRDPFTGAWIIGDIIVGIDGMPVKSYGDLLSALDERRPGDVVQVELLRNQAADTNGRGSSLSSVGPAGQARRVSVELTLGERGALSLAE